MATQADGILALVQGVARPLNAPRLRVVVVDDTECFLEVACALVQFHELADVIGTARDGADAIHAAATLEPDLVLMDVRMPGMNGLEAAAILAQNFPEVRVILMSSEDTPAMRQQARRCGADQFISKMTLAEELVPVLGALFPGRNAASAARQL